MIESFLQRVRERRYVCPQCGCPLKITEIKLSASDSGLRLSELVLFCATQGCSDWRMLACLLLTDE